MAIGFNQPVNYGGRTIGPANTDPRSRALRMREWENYVAQNPGAGEGGTGQTGLSMTDHGGWSWILDKRAQYANDQRANAGKGPLAQEFGGYDGSGVLAPKRGGNVARTAALKGLDDAIGGGGRRRDDQLPQIIADDPALYDAYKDSLLRGFQKKSNAGDPGMEAYEDLRARRLYGVEQEQLDRDQEYADIDNSADARADAYFRHGESVDRRRNELAAELATAKGEAASIDDRIRTAGAENIAETRADATKYSADQRTVAGMMTALQRELGNMRQYGDPNDPRMAGATSRFDSMTSGTPPAGGAGGGGKYIEGRTYRNKSGQTFVYRNGQMVPK